MLDIDAVVVTERPDVDAARRARWDGAFWSEGDDLLALLGARNPAEPYAASASASIFAGS